MSGSKRVAKSEAAVTNVRVDVPARDFQVIYLVLEKEIRDVENYRAVIAADPHACGQLDRYLEQLRSAHTAVLAGRDKWAGPELAAAFHEHDGRRLA